MNQIVSGYSNFQKNGELQIFDVLLFLFLSIGMVQFQFRNFSFSQRFQCTRDFYGFNGTLLPLIFVNITECESIKFQNFLLKQGFRTFYFASALRQYSDFVIPFQNINFSMFRKISYDFIRIDLTFLKVIYNAVGHIYSCTESEVNRRICCCVLGYYIWGQGIIFGVCWCRLFVNCYFCGQKIIDNLDVDCQRSTFYPFSIYPYVASG
eukprot:TRINITY_DN1123_c0_g1_i7.p2 TRINITY_DN1123_c0_g1~~TRINITY_DN1123_c0_g1_i7.p2  ORF type:complete len:208 (-),score=-8.70 TRINITY_DN1123_c0_g1_i7:1570-2193(-)